VIRDSPWKVFAPHNRRGNSRCSAVPGDFGDPESVRENESRTYRADLCGDVDLHQYSFRLTTRNRERIIATCRKRAEAKAAPVPGDSFAA